MKQGWLALAAVAAFAGEASFEVPLTLSAGSTFSSRGGARLTGGFRTVAYPHWNLGSGFFLGGALQAYSRPYFYEQLDGEGYGLRGDVLQSYAGYARNWGRNAVVLKAGILSSAFGSFPLRYDDALNPLIDMPPGYGYYYKSVSTLGLAGAQADITLGRVDGRAQFVTSSAANRRGIFDRDQYGQWAGGAGVTLMQGFRVGTSFYRGPYLHREHRFFRPGEAAPVNLPATGYGLDVQFARGHFSFSGELSRFQRAYRVVPTRNQIIGYAEVKYTVSPRVYVAARIADGLYDFAFGYRLNRRQLLKIGYQHSPLVRNVLGLQLVTQLSPVSH